MKSILSECDGDIDKANKRIDEIARKRSEELNSLTSKVEQAMVDKRTRFSMARAIAGILLLINKK